MSAPRRSLLLLGSAALLLFTLGLGRSALFDGDEATHAEVARQIVRRGDPITLYWNGRSWFDKPPLYMWLTALTGRLFGFTEWSVRIWSAVCGAVGVVATALVGRHLYGPRTGLLAGVILMTTIEYAAVARLALLDAPFVAFMTLALYMVLVASQAGDAAARRRAFRWAWVWAGVATLAKGPIGLVLPAIVTTAWWGVRREWYRVRALPWEGILLYGIIGLTWYAAETARHGIPFLQAVVGRQLVMRFLSGVDNPPGPWYFYVPVLAVFGLPWSAFLPSAVLFLWRHIRRDTGAQFLLVWVGVILLFFSTAATKIPSYVLPLFPAVALIVARLWTVVLEEGNSGAGALLRIGAVALLLAVVGVALAAALRWPTSPPELAAVGRGVSAATLAVAGGAAVSFGLLLRRRTGPALAVVVLSCVLAIGGAVLLILPRYEAAGVRPVKPLAAVLRDTARPGDRVVVVRARTFRPPLVYYAQVPAAAARDAADVRRVLCGSARGFVVTPRNQYTGWVRAAFPDAFTPLVEKGGMMLLRQTRWIPCAPP